MFSDVCVSGGIEGNQVGSRFTLAAKKQGENQPP
jgi:hypothetical protein